MLRRKEKKKKSVDEQIVCGKLSNYILGGWESEKARVRELSKGDNLCFCLKFLNFYFCLCKRGKNGRMKEREWDCGREKRERERQERENERM